MPDKHSYEELIQRIANLEEQNKNLQSESIKYRTLFDSFPHGITISDFHGNVIETNSISERLLGVNKEDHKNREISGKEWRIIGNDGNDMPTNEWASVIALKENRLVTDCEMGIVKPDSQIVWLNVTAAPIPLKGYGVVITYNDITEKKNAEEALQDKNEEYEALNEELRSSVEELQAAKEELQAQNKKLQQTYIALRESEELFRGFFNYSPVGINVFDMEGKVVTVNNVARKYFGVSETDPLSGYRFFEDRSITDETKWKVKHGQIATEERFIDFGVIKEDGMYTTIKDEHDRIFIRVTYSAYGPDLNNPVGLIAIIQNFTERKKQEETLKLQALVMDQICDLVTITDMDGVISYVNQAQTKVLGYSKEALIGYSTQIFGEDPLKSVSQKGIVEKTVKNGFWRGEVVNFDKSGQEHIMDCRTQVISDEQGAPTALCGIATDITDYKNAQKELIESEERFRTVFEQAAVGVARVSPNGGLLEINNKFCQLVGYEKHELYQMTFCDITHPDDLYLDKNYVEQVLAGKINSFEIEKRYIHKDGHHVWVRLYSNAIRNIDGEIKYAVAVVTDISEQKLVEEERQKLQNQLNQAQKLESIGNLAGGIAHDFNNILFPIIGMSEMLLEDLPPGSPERENSEEIYKAGIRGSDLVKQILAFSRQSEHKLIPTRIQNVLKEVLKLSRASIPSYIEIDQNIQQDCGIVMADPSQIHQIGMNIITNAFHAVEDKGGKISVQLREAVLDDSDLAISNMKSGKYAVLSISDTGHGMSEELIGKIFDPYFTTKEQGKGTGLGLAIVYGIIKEHGGHIKVHSEIGKGTTFNVYLPMMHVSSRVEAGNAVGQLQTGSEGILLVDDEQSIANLEKQMLERLGYKVTMCVNSLEALEVFKANPDLFDLVISDMTMPQMTGDRLAWKLIAIRPDIPIIICTGFSERLNQEKAEVLGIKGFLMKPVVKYDMAKMVRKVLDEAKGSAHA